MSAGDSWACRGWGGGEPQGRTPEASSKHAAWAGGVVPPESGRKALGYKLGGCCGSELHSLRGSEKEKKGMEYSNSHFSTN